ncbi:energy-coupling factor transporter transmembrane component T, partial [Paenibacillus arenilitoris]
RALEALRAAAALPPDWPAPDGVAPWPGPREVAAMLAARLAKPALAAAAAEEAYGLADAANASANDARAYAANDGAASADAIDARADAIPVTANDVHAIAVPAMTNDPRATAVTTSANDATGANNPRDAAPPAAVNEDCIRAQRFDPRSLVAAYFLLAAGVFAQRSLADVGLTAVLALLLLLPFNALLKPWLGLVRAYATLIAIFCLIGGTSLDPLSFDWGKALPIAIRFGKLLIVMLLGMPLLGLMTPMRLQRAIEQTFGWLSRLRVPVHSLALLVTLIFRFIPLLAEEWGRFAKLAHARGKAASPVRSVPPRMLRSILIPYVRSMLRTAEQMADALEARGFGYAKRNPVYAFRLRFGRADALLLAIAAASASLMVLLALIP